MAQGPMTDLGKFRGILQQAKNIVVLSGAGISAESGIPTFRGAGGFWRSYQSTDLATLQAFKRSPSLVWEFYHYRRELVLSKQPNKAHIAIAEAEKTLAKAGKKLTVITQNVDELHQRAGSKNVIELHGSLFKTSCLECGDVVVNKDSPICQALAGRGAPDVVEHEEIPEDQLPRCKNGKCRGLLRPHVVWFGENLDSAVLDQADEALVGCEACLVVGTSSVVYPAAMFADSLVERSVPVAEFNIEDTLATGNFMFHFKGPSSQTVPEALKDFIKSPNDEIPLSKTPSGSVSSASSSTNLKDEPKPKLSRAQRLKAAVAQYGTTVIVFHIGISLISLGGFYLAFSCGVDMDWLVSKLGFEPSSVSTSASTFVMAYAVHKLFAPVRISLTLGSAPFIVRHLRNIGIIKKTV